MKFLYAILVACMGTMSVSAAELSSDKIYKAAKQTGCPWLESATVDFPVTSNENGNADDSFVILFLKRDKPPKGAIDSILGSRISSATTTVTATCLTVGKYTARAEVLKNNILTDTSNIIEFEIQTTQVIDTE